MSRQRECQFFEPHPQLWYYLLDDSGRSDSWDWREVADCYGPFISQDVAIKHLHANHANPGGYSVVPHDQFQRDETYENAMREATNSKFSLHGRWW